MGSRVGRRLRDAAFAAVRGVHKRTMLKALPERAAIYFHALPRQHHAAFADCIGYFRAEGYRIVSLDAYVSPATSGRILFVSFDDNYLNWYESLDLLARLDVRATFYTNSLPFMDTCAPAERVAYFQRIDYAESLDTVTRGQLREIAAAGHEIGCHTHSHFDLAQLDRSRWHDEIDGCRRRLEDVTGSPVRHFAYPYGMRRYFSAQLHSYCRELGFASIATAIPGLQHVRPVDPYNVHRTRWRLTRSVEDNVVDLRIDGRAFEALTGRSAVG